MGTSKKPKIPHSLPFGITNSPYIFNCLIDSISTTNKIKYNCFFFDDLILVGKSDPKPEVDSNKLSN